MGKLSEVALNILGAGGEYISLNDIIADYSSGITINGAFLRQTADKEFPCFTFAEDSNKYFYAVAGDIARLFDSWLSTCNDDINELNEALRLENIKIKIQKVKTKSGKTYTKAWVIDVIEVQLVEEVTPEDAQNYVAPF